ncbi:MAG: AAA family ATPase, partial [Thalassospira sp.]|nr:AAA family ATPase [Thalassospira sp.]
MGTLLDDASDVPPDLIAPRILTHGGLGVLGGAPKVGKSDLLICWMAHMAAGLPFLGMTPPRPLKIFYFQLEIGYHYLRESLRALSFDETAWPLVRKNLVITPQVNCLLNEQGVSKLRDTILCFFEPGEVDVIVIDPLRNVFDSSKGANENDNTAMLQFLQERVECLRQMVNPMAGVILAHHIRKIQKKQLEE